MGDFLEEGIKSSKVQCMAALQVAKKAIQSGSISIGKKKKEEVSAPFYHPQPQYNPHRANNNQNPHRPYAPVQTTTHQNRPAYAPRPRLNFEERGPRTYTPIAEPLAQLLERLRRAGLIHPIEGRVPEHPSKYFDATKRCVYYSNVPGHDTEDCFKLKNEIETLIKRGAIQCTLTPPNVNRNPLPNHQNQRANMITLDEEYDLKGTVVTIGNAEVARISPQKALNITVQMRPIVIVLTYLQQHATVTGDEEICYAPEDVNRGLPGREKITRRNITNPEAAEFWKRMSSKEYSVEEQLMKTPAQISIMDMLMSTKRVSQVLVNGGSWVNICPLSTLRELGIHLGEVKESHVRVRAFDGSQKDVIGEIYLALQIGKVDFPVLFQLMDILSCYNLLLGMPWIHMARAMPSTLHQYVKFEWGYQEIVVHGVWGHSAYLEYIVTFIEGLDGVALHALGNPVIVQIQDGYEGDDEIRVQARNRVGSQVIWSHRADWHNASGKKARTVSTREKDFVPENVASPGQSSVPEDDTIDRMGKLFMSMIEECYEGTDIKTPTIRDAEPGEELQNSTASPSLVRRSLGSMEL
ncbi:hypothetical protein A4A49_52056 [Nicotiana attenuata]|uniref:Uncharacterized protein n=1 Tax=Nicotiana attenuata TaxID=49451 RepID=A0A1J6IRY4_NICAT|nr:hypothetical protein A4A49_52056 [Nicotiana attenuata]